jgi:diguanylate cyclase (GGDEF)-like protein
MAIVLSLVLATFVWNQRQVRLRNDMAADFAFESREMALRLVDRLRAHRQILRGVRASLAFQGVPARDEWSRYVANQFLDVDFPGMQGVGYVTRRLMADREVHEQRMRASGYPDYAVFGQRSDEATLAPVVRLAPDQVKNSHLLGFDMWSDPELRRTLAASVENAGAQLSRPVPLPVPGSGDHAPLIFLTLPIFPPPVKTTAEAVPAGPTPVPALNEGWIFSVFKAPDLIKATLGHLPGNTHLRVYADTELTDAHILYDSSPLGHPGWGTETPLQVQTPLTLDGQIWMLVFEGFPRAYDRKVSFNWELFSILAICALFSLSAILVTVTRRSSLRLLRLTQELTDSNQRYEFLATHDALTKAANRVLFQSRLETTLAEAARYKRQFGLIYIDLDKFKPVNDVHGHHTGDLLLQSVTDRLAHLLRDSDLLARRGGDEFVVLLPLVDGNEAVETVAHKICTELATPFDLEGLTVHISGSLGLAIYPTDGETVEDLINQADSRMYAAKQRGGNRWVFL